MNPILLASVFLLGIVSLSECRKYKCDEYTEADADRLFDIEKGNWKAEWKRLNKKHGNSFGSEQAEEAHRRNLYRKAAKEITKENKRNGGKYCLQLNRFATMDGEERDDYTGGVAPTSYKGRGGAAAASSHDIPKRSVPASLFHPTGDVGNQGECLSCALWSTVHVLNGFLIKEHNKTIELSEKQLVDCYTVDDYDDYGYYHYTYKCGTLPTEAGYDYFKTHLPVQKHAYAANNFVAEECATVAYGQFVQDYAFYASDATTDDLLVQLLQNGPVSVTMDQGPNFLSRGAGILEKDPSITCKYGHLVTLVGYGSEDGVDYFIVKNSYGYDWAEKGYFRVRRLGGGTTYDQRYCDWGALAVQPTLSPGALLGNYEHVVPATAQKLPYYVTGVPEPDIKECCITVYDQIYFGGKSQRFCGKYSQVGADWAEAIASLRVEAHCLAWIYTNTGVWEFTRETARADSYMDSAVHAIEVA